MPAASLGGPTGETMSPAEVVKETRSYCSRGANLKGISLELARDATASSSAASVPSPAPNTKVAASRRSSCRRGTTSEMSRLWSSLTSPGTFCSM